MALIDQIYGIVLGSHMIPEWLLFGAVFMFGLLMGSFINVCIYRLPREESVVFPASHCPSCNQTIRPYDNVPLLSYLLLRGRCRSCRGVIPWRYPLIELLHGLGALFLVGKFGFSLTAAAYGFFMAACVAVIFIDLAHQIIPDEITLLGIGVGIVASATVLPTGWVDAITGLLLGGGLFYLIAMLSEIVLKKEGMGGGDIKFIAMIGAFLGWQNMLLTILLASLSGSVVGLIRMRLKGYSRSEPIPFGPFLSVGACFALLWGETISNWYVNMAYSP